ncbi:MAG: acetylornithine deacetylase [Aromatoleum sp.]|nr:acetylornithine deacetylase [Aromatoleum sp.]
MNAPATPNAVRPDARTAAPDLVAWDLIRTLVAFDTTSRESNLALIEWVRSYLRSHGVDATLTFDDDGRKANLFATLPAQDGNETTGGIVLSGHTDVVPVDGQPWDTPPFEAVRIGDKVHGRGVTDMKSFSATGLALVPEFLRRGLKRPVHFALSYDEEIGCVGVRRLIEDVVRRGVKPLGCIVGEPTGMELVVAHKGKKSWRCRVRGHEAHSSLTPLGVNAVQIACEIVTYLTNIARSFRDHGSHDTDYDVPFTTVHTGVIHGGTALNIVARDCWFDFEIRHLPFDDPDELYAEVKEYALRFLPEMRQLSADTWIEFDALSTLPGFDTHGESEIAELGKACNGTHDYHKVSFGAEASLFHEASIPAIICGPGHIAQAHQPNEWVALEQLARCESFMRRLADRVCVA